MPSKAKYITEARKMFHEKGVFEILPNAEVDIETVTLKSKGKKDKEVQIGAYVHCRIWLHEEDID